MERIKESILAYHEKLKTNKRRSLSRICNCTEGAFLLLMTIYVIQSWSSWTIFMLVLSILLLLRVLHVYIIISDAMDVRILYLAMILCQVIISGIGFFYTPILLFMALILGMMIGFPFLFHKFTQLKQ